MLDVVCGPDGDTADSLAAEEATMLAPLSPPVGGEEEDVMVSVVEFRRVCFLTLLGLHKTSQVYR